MTSVDVWENVKSISPDPIFGLVEEFKKDTSDKKISLVVGAYRDDDNKPYIFTVVDKAEHLLLEEKVNKEYLPVSGFKDFIDGAKRLVFGDDANFDSISAFQALSGTGSLYLGGCFLNKFYQQGFKILIPDPSWPIHDQVFQLAGITNQAKYQCYDNDTNTFAFENMVKCITEAEDGSVLLLHACAHNPTGTDPSKEQWEQILTLCQNKKILPFFDLAYQGFASGNFDDDAYAVRLFYKAGMQMLVAQSFAKNAGLYGERVGALHIVCTSPEIAHNVKTNVERIIRSAYSNPPIHGAYIMGRILKDQTLFDEWAEELKQVANRIQQMRVSLRSEIEKLNTPGDWSHITKQIGMFSYTGLNKRQCERLMKEHHVYLLKSGRISMSGVNTKNVENLAKSINEVVCAKYPELVAITGITGYIGSEICFQVLQAGYSVKGIARNIKQANYLKENVFPHKDKLEIVEASLTDPLSKWEELLVGVDYVIDVASPVDFAMPEAEMVSIATKGIENVMKASIKNKVKKVVYTSSVAACSDIDMNINEESWLDPKRASFYPKSKADAEKLAWSLYKEQKGEMKTELTCILPVFVYGPSIQNRILSSLTFLKMMLQNKMLIMNCSMCLVDVRDVANAHLISLKEKKSDGQRYILHNKSMWVKDIAKVMDDEASKYGIKVNHKPCWDITVKILAKFVRMLGFFAKSLGVEKNIDNSKSIKELGINYIPMEKTIIESMYSCIHNGALN